MNAKEDNEKKTKSVNNPDVYDSGILDSKLIERQTMETHLRKPNTVNGMYVNRPESSRTTGQTTRSLTGELIKNEDFKHNNMVPFFGGSVRQNVDPNATSGIVERFTGVSEGYKSKEEMEPLFENKQENIYGRTRSVR